MNLADRLQHTSASQVVRAVEQSRAFLARELVQQLVSQKKIYYWNFILGRTNILSTYVEPML